MGLNRFHIRHPGQLKKSKSWEPFGSYQLNSMPIQPIYLKIGPNWLNRQCCLAGSSKMAPWILIFSIAMGGNYFQVKSIDTCAATFFWFYYFSLNQCVAYSLLSFFNENYSRSGSLLSNIPQAKQKLPLPQVRKTFLSFFHL